MAETLGTLADKLTTVKLKLWHTDDAERTKSLQAQEKQLQDEIDEFVRAALTGEIPFERLTFAANKVYKKEGNALTEFSGTIGEIFSQLAEVNTRLWHIQEKVYEFDKIAVTEKDEVIKQLAIVNLERNQCIDKLDVEFRKAVETIAFNK
jgi:phenylalanyl-tRNA synthetase alpha subunit